MTSKKLIDQTFPKGKSRAGPAYAPDLALTAAGGLY